MSTLTVIVAVTTIKSTATRLTWLTSNASISQLIIARYGSYAAY